jgi:hypothetical protein
MSEDDDDRKLPAIQNRVIGAAVEIDQDDPLGIIYQHSLFCQVALPRSRPEGRVFERAYRNGSIRMHAGELWDGTRWIEQPLPAGPKPRLALCHLNSEAVKTRCPVVEVDRSARKFMERLGLNTDGGSTYNLFKREMKALAACRMTLGFGDAEHPVTVDAKPIRRFEAWLTHEKGSAHLVARRYRTVAGVFRQPAGTRRAARSPRGQRLGAFRDGAGRLQLPRAPPVHAGKAGQGHMAAVSRPVRARVQGQGSR